MGNAHGPWQRILCLLVINFVLNFFFFQNKNQLALSLKQEAKYWEINHNNMPSTTTG
jgi:hypothetical protein